MCGGLINYFYNERFLYLNKKYLQNTNLIIFVLYHHLFTQLFLETTYSKTLYIQIDNCFDQNKNYYFLAFCAFLVYISWFIGVLVSFLSTSIIIYFCIVLFVLIFINLRHTHIDIDQLFASPRIHYHDATITTFTDLLPLLQKSTCINIASKFALNILLVFKLEHTPEIISFNLVYN